jgi:hypothetical protein
VEVDFHLGMRLASTDLLLGTYTDTKQEGLLTIVVAIAGYWFINNYPDTAKFLSDKERRFIQARLATDSDATRDEAFTWANVLHALKDPKCWLYGFAFHTMSLPLYTLSLFLVSFLVEDSHLEQHG